MKNYTYKEWLEPLDKVMDMYRQGTEDEAVEIGAEIFYRQIQEDPEVAIHIICHTLAALLTERARRPSLN